MRITGMIFIVLLLAGCAPSQTQLRMEMDLEQMKRRLAQIEVQKAENTQSDVIDETGLQRQVAEVQAGLDTMRVEFNSINGLIDDLGREQRNLAEELRLVRDDLNLQVDSLTSRIEELSESINTAAPAPVSAPEPSPQAPADAPERTPEQQYEAGLGMILNSTDFAQGRQLLEDFTSSYPNHDLYVNALYWTGEALYGEKKFEDSILQFQDVISKYPRHNKAPDALYKQALAFNALGDTQNARATMRKLLDSYPDTEQARAAEKFLQN